jgi:NADH-quinone oxidoreductase subunit G
MEAALRTANWLITGKEAEKLEFDEIHGLEGVKEMSVNVGGTELRIAVAHGLSHVQDVIRRIRAALAAGEEPPWHFVEVMACPGGCVGGGGQFWGVHDGLRKQRAKGLENEDRAARLRCSHQNPDVRKLYDDYIEKPLSEKAHHLFHTHSVARNQYSR